MQGTDCTLYGVRRGVQVAPRQLRHAAQVQQQNPSILWRRSSPLIGRKEMENPGRARLDRRHDIHVIVRGVISDWNDHKQVLHMGHKIDLAAAITEALMADAGFSSKGNEP